MIVISVEFHNMSVPLRLIERQSGNSDEALVAKGGNGE